MKFGQTQVNAIPALYKSKNLMFVYADKPHGPISPQTFILGIHLLFPQKKKNTSAGRSHSPVGSFPACPSLSPLGLARAGLSLLPPHAAEQAGGSRGHKPTLKPHGSQPDHSGTFPEQDNTSQNSQQLDLMPPCTSFSLCLFPFGAPPPFCPVPPKCCSTWTCLTLPSQPPCCGVSRQRDLWICKNEPCSTAPAS